MQHKQWNQDGFVELSYSQFPHIDGIKKEILTRHESVIRFEKCKSHYTTIYCKNKCIEKFKIKLKKKTIWFSLSLQVEDSNYL